MKNACLDAALSELNDAGIRDVVHARGGKHWQIRYAGPNGVARIADEVHENLQQLMAFGLNGRRIIKHADDLDAIKCLCLREQREFHEFLELDPLAQRADLRKCLLRVHDLAQVLQQLIEVIEFHANRLRIGG